MSHLPVLLGPSLLHSKATLHPQPHLLPRQMSVAVSMGEEAQGPPLAPLHMVSLEKRGGLARPVADIT